jgi:hypothetical protein
MRERYGWGQGREKGLGRKGKREERREREGNSSHS